MHESCIIFSKKKLARSELCKIMDPYYEGTEKMSELFSLGYWDIQDGFLCWKEVINDANVNTQLFNLDIAKAKDSLECCAFIDIHGDPHVHQKWDWRIGKWDQNDRFKDELMTAIQETRDCHGYFTVLDYHR